MFLSSYIVERVRDIDRLLSGQHCHTNAKRKLLDNGGGKESRFPWRLQLHRLVPDPLFLLAETDHEMLNINS